MEQYHVTGMTCAACSAHVEKAVKAVDGVSSVTVSLLTNAMSVEGTASPQAVIAAVEKAGYGASLAGASQEETTTAADLEDHETPKLKKRLIASLCLLLPLMCGVRLCPGVGRPPRDPQRRFSLPFQCNRGHPHRPGHAHPFRQNH